ncbi:MAG TPA: amidohydrolase family protein, partial [Acidimicrobiales bacterium]|nr:amidohydrolase family protein [Acidimicrobiales bacterium]
LQDKAVALAVPQPLPSPEDRMAKMDAAGVEMQVLSVSAPSVFRLPAELRRPLTRDLNDELGAMAAGSAGRLKVFASLPLPDVEDALEEIDRVAKHSEVVGFALCTTIDRRTLDDACFAPVWDELSRRQAVVFVHPTTGCCTEGVREYALALALDFLAETTNAIGRMSYSGAFERYDGIRWIFTHLGGTIPFVFHRLDNYASQFPENRANITARPSEIVRRLHFDTVTTHAPALRCAVDTLSADRLLFGTDYPHVPGGLEVFVKTLESIGLTPEELHAVGSSNARRLLRIDAAADPGDGSAT